MMPRCNQCVFEKIHGNQEPCVGCHDYINFKPKETALNKQEGGNHYKDNAIQPIVYIHANKLGFCEGNVVKYITRHKEKNGAEDIRKVIHYCELLLELEYKNATNT
jgi:hypothetical protein